MSTPTNTNILLASSTAALTVDLLLYPLDTLKTRLQASEQNVKLNPALFRGLYQGLGSFITATLPAAGLFFTTYEASNSFLTRTFPALPAPLVYASSSIVAEALACGIECPAEVLKQNAQVAPSGRAGIIQVFRALPAWGNLYKGYGALLARNGPVVGVQMPIYEGLRGWLRERGNRKDGEGPLALGEVFLRSGGSGAVAAATASLVTQPVDVVKTRVMLTATTSTSPISLAGVEGTEMAKQGDYRQVVGKIWKEEGWRSFWRGGALRMVWMGVGGGLYLGCYESAKVWLGEEKEVEGL